jgi:hypothetical protein
MPDLVDALGNLDGENPQPEEFCALLVSLGFKDETPRVFPDEEAEGETRRLRSVARGLDFDRMGVKQLRRLIEAVRDLQAASDPFRAALRGDRERRRNDEC